MVGRPRIGEHVMTTAERQRRHRAKLREIVHAEDVLEVLARDYRRALPVEAAEIRRGVSKLLTRWHKDEAARRQWWDKQKRRRAAG